MKCDRIIFLQCLQGVFFLHTLAINSAPTPYFMDVFCRLFLHTVYIDIAMSQVNCHHYNQQSSFQCKPYKAVSVDG